MTTSTDALARKLAIPRQDTFIGTRLTARDLVGFGRFPRHRALVAMNFAQSTDLLLDEPLNNLDIAHAGAQMPRLREMADRHGRTVVSSTK